MAQYTLSKLRGDLKALATKQKAEASAWFFKTGKGQYGEGDKFLGVTVPEQRKVARKYRELPLAEVKKLLASPWHEHRLVALFILVDQFENGDEKMRKSIYNLYLKNTRYVNNWDLVDSSAYKIVGEYMFTHSRKQLYTLARSKDLWKQRIAIIATARFIQDNQYDDTLKISKILLHHEHDLIHRAVGWMLREVGKRDQKVEEEFLGKYYKVMPRTMLRYAIEKFSKSKKSYYMKK